MNAKVYGKLAGLVSWPAFACLSIWLAAGEMPPAIEKIYVTLLWGIAAVLLVSALGVGVLCLAGLRGEGKVPVRNTFDRIFPVVVIPSRLVLIFALFLAGAPILASLFIAGFLGLAALGSLTRKRAVAAND